MALYIKKHWSKGAKIAGIVLFTLLMIFNLQISTSADKGADISLMGLRVSLAVPSAYAEDVPGVGGYSCSVTVECRPPAAPGSISCTGDDKCERSFNWVKCDGHETFC